MRSRARLSRIKTLLSMFLVVIAFDVDAQKIGDFMAALETGSQAAKEQQLNYWSGALDALMYANEALIPLSGGTKFICFPAPIPSRKVLYELFINQVQLVVQNKGMAVAENMSVDQMIFASWIRRYSCPGFP